MRAPAALLLLASALPAAAQTSEVRPARTSRAHYDHRAPEDRSADEAWRWIPRILLTPLSFALAVARATTQLVLEPIGPPPSSVDATEDAPAPLFAMPVIHLESEMSPALGAWVRLIPDEMLRVDLAAQHWDDARVEGWGTARLALGDGAGSIALLTDVGTRGDRIFHGIGHSEPDARRRYRQTRGGGSIEWRHDAFYRSSAIAASLRATHHRFEESGFGGASEPSLTAQDPDRPAGFVEGATVIEPRLALAIDSRSTELGAGNEGVALSMIVALATDVEHDARWTRAEARAEATVRLAPEHDLTFSGWAASVDPIAGAIPFVELVVLGGEPGQLAGFPLGRLHGRSAAIAGARYRWGIHQDGDAALHVELGNVFGASYDGFAIERGRLSIGISIDGLATDEHRLSVLFALGTAPLDGGGAIESGHVRFFVGSPPR
jgi:hypothetical protein